MASRSVAWKPPIDRPVVSLPAWLDRWGRWVCLLAGAALPLGFAPFAWFWLVPPLLVVLLACWTDQPPREAAWRGFYFGAGAFGTGTYWLYISIVVFGGSPVWLAIVLMLGLVTVSWPATWPWPAGPGFACSQLHPPWRCLPGSRRSGCCRNGCAAGSLPASLAEPGLWADRRAAVRLGTGRRRLRGLARHGNPCRRTCPAAAGQVRPGARLGQSPSWCPGGRRVSCCSAGPGRNRRANRCASRWCRVRFRRTANGCPSSGDRPCVYTRNSLSPSAGPNWSSGPRSRSPAMRYQVDAWLDDLDEKARRAGISLLLGILVDDFDNEQFYNSLISGGEAEGEYHKRHLVPFGEFFPVPTFIRNWMRLMSLPNIVIPPTAIGSNRRCARPASCCRRASATRIPTARAARFPARGHGAGQRQQRCMVWRLDRAAPAPADSAHACAGKWPLHAARDQYRHHRDSSIASGQRCWIPCRSSGAGVLRGEVVPHGGATPFVRFGNAPAVLLSLVLPSLLVLRAVRR